MKAIIGPSDVKMIQDAIELFGKDRVITDILGVWREPIHIKDLTEEEMDFAKEYFYNMGKKIEVVP